MVERVLVVGASGALGRVIAARLVAGGASVRGMTRDAARLADLAAQGAEVVEGDLLQPATLVTACEGVGQIVSTANSFSGVGANSPTRVDVPGYRNLLAADSKGKYFSKNIRGHYDFVKVPAKTP